MFKSTIKKVFSIKVKIAKILAYLSLILGIGMVAPYVHNAYIRAKVGSQVVMLTNKEGTSGGTGFVMKAPNGKIYTITNAHVCNIPGNKLYTVLPSGKKVSFKIIKKSRITDLCALTPVEGYSGLSLSDKVYIGETIGVVGHPKLMPLAVTLGELLGYADVAVLVSMEPCTKDVGMYSSIITPFGYICIETVKKAGLTTLTVRGGSSGSPVVDFFGNVVGVLFAGDELGWGIIVSLSDLRKFLNSLN